MQDTLYIYKQYNEIPDFLKSFDNLNDVKKKIIDALNDEKYSENIKRVSITEFAKGSTSICYKGKFEYREIIIKLFSPEFVKKEEKQELIDNDFYNFSWLNNEANDISKIRYLNRFKRFVNQLDNIISIISEANKKRNNLLLSAELALTSKGIALIFDNYYGENIDDELCKFDILNRIELIEKCAVSINKYIHGAGLYHGDIKPDNFFKINFEDDNYVVRNIDFDTCVEIDDIKSGFLVDNIISTTPIFYDESYIKRIHDKKNEKEWIYLDVKALTELFLYSILNNDERQKLLKILCERQNSNIWINTFDKLMKDSNNILNVKINRLCFLFIKKEILDLAYKYFYPSEEFFDNDYAEFTSFLIEDIKHLKNTIKCLLVIFGLIQDNYDLNDTTIRLVGIKKQLDSMSNEELESIEKLDNINDYYNYFYN